MDTLFLKDKLLIENSKRMRYITHHVFLAFKDRQLVHMIWTKSKMNLDFK